MEQLLAIALLLPLATAVVQADWAGWGASEKAGEGSWLWTGPTSPSTPVAVGLAAEGVFRVTVGLAGPAPEHPLEATISPGSIELPGLPKLTFEHAPGMMRCTLPARPDERFFGLGEKYNAVNQRGKAVNMWVDDGYRSLGDKTYLPVPMYLSSASYGLYLDATTRSEFRLASDDKTVTITNHAPTMSLYLFTGASYPELLSRYCAVTGLPEVPPEWAFGIWLSRSSYSSQDEVLQVARRWRALDLPLALFNIEGWKGKTYHSFNDKTFPDPRAMIRELHEYGWKVMLWNTHNIPPTDPDYKTGDERGYFAKGPDGKTYNVPEGYGAGGCLDVTDSEAVKWWNSLYDPLLAMGVDALFNDVTNYLDDDFGEQRFGRMRFANGKTTEELHNLYWLLFNRVTYEYMKAKTGGETVLRVAGGWAGQQKYSTVWAGDSASTWEFLQRDIKALLSAGWSGIPYFGYDIPGYSDAGNPVTPELYIRWVQFGALSPMMQFHSTAHTEPWHYGDKAIQVLRLYGWLRESLLPYIYSLALQAQTTGAPIARSLAWHYPDDAEAAGVEDEYLLGPSLLVAPVCTPATDRRVYIPAGVWLDLFDGSRYEGPRSMTESAPLEHLPVYIREGSIVPVKLGPALDVGAPLHDDFIRALEIMPPPDGATAEFAWLRKEGRHDLRCVRRGREVTFEASGNRLPTSTLLRIECGPPEKVLLDGKVLSELKEPDISVDGKRGFCYRPTEQVCFVAPGEGWQRVTLTERRGQLQWVNWNAPKRIAANAGPLAIEVSITEVSDSKPPVLVYRYQGGSGQVIGRRLPETPKGSLPRWRFEVPITLSEKEETVEWSVVAPAKTETDLQSRPRLTTVITPSRISAPATLRLGTAGEFAVTVLSNSEKPTRGQLTFTAPVGITLIPDKAAYALAGAGASQLIKVQYRAAADLLLGEHPIVVHNTVSNVELPGATILTARPFAWHVVGPFPGGSREDWLTAFRAALPPEAGPVDLAAEYETPAGKVKWQPYPADGIGDDGMIDLERIFGKIDFRTAYLYTTFESPAERDVLLKVGSDDALMLWVNGEKVHEFPAPRAAVRDQDSVKAHLKAGRNTVLAKVHDWGDAWRFYFRVTDPAGNPIGNLRP